MAYIVSYCVIYFTKKAVPMSLQTQRIVVFFTCYTTNNVLLFVNIVVINKEFDVKIGVVARDSYQGYHEGCQKAVAVNSCGTALDLCMMALGVGEGDEVIVPGQTFVYSIGKCNICM